MKNTKPAPSWSFLVIAFIFLSVSSVAKDPQDFNEQINQLSFVTRDTADYRIGPGDLIEVSVYGEEDLSRTLRVSQSGVITLPFLGQVSVTGLSAAELEVQIREGLDTRFIKNPQVSVFVKEYRSQPLFILGAVNKPGEYQMQRQLHLIDALAMAGGLDQEKAGEKILIQRKPSASESVKSVAKNSSISIDLKQLLESGDPLLNVALAGGDIINIPEHEKRVYYVMGDVGKPGIYEFPHDDLPVLVTQALAGAGGLMKTAKANSGILVRYNEQGERQELAVKVNDLLSGKATDFSINPQDVIFIPSSTFKSIGYGLIGAIPNTVSGSIIYGPIR